jgi:uncharacterized membrane protein HdeD (DUF308 family)
MSDVYADLSDLPAAMARHWWIFALRGVLAILFGILAFAWPGITIAALLALFAAYMLLDGIFAIGAALRAHRSRESFWPLLLEGIADIAAAAIAVMWPGVTLFALIYLAAAWALISGILLLIGAIRMPSGTSGRGLLGLNGAFSAIWGIAVALFPIAGLLVMTWWLGAYAVFFGVLLLVAAVRLNRLYHREHAPTHARTAGI